MMKHTEEPPNVLLVDDQDANLFALEAVLETLGCNLIKARSGQEALEWLLGNKECALILLDVQMPGMDGFETATLIKEREKSSHIPIIFVTAVNKEERFVSQGYSAGAVDYITKPFDVDNLKSKVAVFVNLFEYARQNHRQSDQLLQAERRRQTERRAVQRQRAHQDQLHLAELAASEARLSEFKSLMDATLDGVFIFDAHTLDFSYTNHGGVGQLGYAREEILTLTPLDFFSEQDGMALRGKLNELRAGTLPSYTFQAQQKRKDGSQIPVELFLQFITPEGHAGHFVAVARDISERKAAEATERESQRFFQSTLDALISHIAVLDESGEIIAVNKAWRQFSEENEGTAASCGVGANYIEVCRRAKGDWAQEAPAVIQGIQDVMETRHKMFCREYPCHSATEQRWFKVCATRFVGEGPVRVAISHENITEHKRDEAALSHSEERYRSLTMATAQIVWTTSADGMIEDMPAWRDFTGQSLEEVKGRGWTQALHPSDRERLEKTVDHCLEIGMYEDEYRIRAANGDYRLFAVRGVPIFNEDGSVREWVGTFTDIHDRRQAEEERDRFFTISLDMLAIIGSDGYFKRVNPAWEATLGFSDAEIMAVPFLEFVHPDDRAATVEEDEKLVRGGELMRFENRYRCRDGSYKWLLWMCASFEDLIYCVTHDVTEAKQTERAIRESEEYFRFLNDLTEATRPLADAEQVMAVTSQMLGEHLGVSRCAYADVEPDGDQFTILHDYTDGCASTVGDYQLSLFGPRAVATLASGNTLILRDVAAELLPNEGAEMFNAIGIQAIIVCPLVKDGVLRAMMAVHQTIPRDWQPGEITLVQDVVERCWATVERRTAEERLLQLNAELEQRVMDRTSELEEANVALREEEIEQQQIMATLTQSEERFRLLVESVHDYAILMMDTEGHIMTWNAGAERMKGYRADDIIGQHFSCFYTEEDQQAGKPDQELRIAEAEGYFDGEVWRVRQDGSRFWATLVITALRDESGNLRGFAKITRDITERKKIEAALHEAKAEAERANLAKSEFLSRMSHELRTPLNAIIGFGQILDRGDIAPRDKESVGHILKGGHHLLGLINEVLDIARVEAGHVDLSIEPIALADVVPEVCELVRPLAAERNIHLHANTSKMGRISVLADLQRLKQVLINLLSNAIKYNREDGQVEVSCGSKREGWISIEIRDTGPGIAPEDLLKLFIPFERLNAAKSSVEGTGLGLVLSQRLVKAMSGTLSVESIVGQGTIFTVELPETMSTDEQLADLPKDIVPTSTAKKNERTYIILCIEDNSSNLRLMEAIFDGRPEIELLTAIQGSVGLDLARQHEPNLVLLDLDLPDIHGSEVLARLQQSPQTRDIPVVIISADATPKQIERLLTDGARAYLTKPLDIDQFLQTVDEFLRNKSEEKIS